MAILYKIIYNVVRGGNVVKKGYEHIDITFSNNNEKEMELYNWLDENKGILNTSTYIKVLLFELMNKEKGSEK